MGTIALRVAAHEERSKPKGAEVAENSSGAMLLVARGAMPEAEWSEAPLQSFILAVVNLSWEAANQTTSVC